MHPDRARLQAWRDGELSPREGRRIARHLEHCAECRLQSELDRWRVERLLNENPGLPAGAARRDEFQQLLRSMRSSPRRPTRALLTLLIGRKAASNEPAWPAGARILKPLTAILAVATAVHVVLGIIVWSGWAFIGNLEWARAFFTTAGDLFLVELAAAGFYLSLKVLGGFTDGEPLYEGWFLICTACGCDVAGSFFSKLLATHTNPLWSQVQPLALSQFGLFLSGPMRLALLALGMYSIVRAYHRAGIMTFRFSLIESALLACLTWYTICENIQGILARRVDGQWTLQYFIQSSNDPLLLMVLIAVLLLRRSVRNLGGRYVERCWTAMAWGFGLIFLGNIATWALNSGYLSLRVTSIGWNIWFLAAAGFPLACAFQLHAMVKTAEFEIGRETNGASTPGTASQG
jgi:hypothetical protein